MRENEFLSTWPQRKYFLLYLGMCIFFLCGIGWGVREAILLDSQEKEIVVQEAAKLLNTVRQSYKPETVFIYTSGQLFSIYLLLFLIGLSAIGFPVAFAVVFSRGVMLGFTGAILASQNPGKGVFLALAALLPQNIVYLPSLLLAASGTVVFALKLFKVYFSREKNLGLTFAGYVVLMVFAVAAAYGAAAVEAYLSPKIILYFLK
ncbi:stage II sporulation protein M [Carboxydothermus islandicus]|uniref:Stage II sporulation protein M n=1 Tax=Carboxydothermus islandicus TaxID=661089 RepID=A0A1L8D389_9THEO|nr:stage II sporulation protein M [Carboxydothermus islandicus]GAV25633.1 stage II sporulation protein M [Carboxydothermus islandicus]